MNPVLVEVVRGSLVESRHRGAFLVADARGEPVMAAGDVEQIVYPRSACKVMQALPMVESGAADAFDFDAPELALACASHTGSMRHIEGVRRMLRKAKLNAEMLDCGPQIPRDSQERARLVRKGLKETQLHHACSGKHTGFLAFARHMGFETHEYTDAAHPVQRHVRQVIGEVCGVDPESLPYGVDGCSAPNFAMPLRAFVRGLARCAQASRDPALMGERRGAALARLFAANGAEPFMVAGWHRLDTGVMQETGGALILKCGAEGGMAAYLPEKGLGAFVKIEDGADRAAGSVMSEILVRLGALPPGSPALQAHHKPAIRNARGLITGMLRPVSSVFTAAVV